MSKARCVGIRVAKLSAVQEKRGRDSRARKRRSKKGKKFGGGVGREGRWERRGWREQVLLVAGPGADGERGRRRGRWRSISMLLFPLHFHFENVTHNWNMLFFCVLVFLDSFVGETIKCKSAFPGVFICLNLRYNLTVIISHGIANVLASHLLANPSKMVLVLLIAIF